MQVTNHRDGIDVCGVEARAKGGFEKEMVKPQLRGYLSIRGSTDFSPKRQIKLSPESRGLVEFQRGQRNGKTKKKILKVH